MLSVKQRKLLELLSINCRFSNKDIAKVLRVSEDTVSYQIHKLIETEKLSRFTVTFDYHMLGYKSYHLFVRVRHTNFDVDKLKSISKVISINTSYGKYDIQLVFLAKSATEKRQLLQKIQEIIPIKNYYIAEFFDFYKSFTNIIPPISLKTKVPKNQKNFIYTLNSRNYPQLSKEKIKLDASDKVIVKTLLKNPRISYYDMHRSTNLNHETIRYRIKRLLDEGFIKNFGLLHDFEKYELYTSYLLLKFNNVNESKFSAFLMSIEEIFYAAKLKGKYSCILYIASKDPTELSKVFQNIREFFQETLEDTDVIHMDELIKYIQFPYWELE